MHQEERLIIEIGEKFLIEEILPWVLIILNLLIKFMKEYFIIGIEFFYLKFNNYLNKVFILLLYSNIVKEIGIFILLKLFFHLVDYINKINLNDNKKIFLFYLF